MVPMTKIAHDFSPHDDLIDSLDLTLRNPSPLIDAYEVSERVLLKGGKRWRPRLCLMIAEGLGLPWSKVKGYARVAELVHAASLAHDDVIDQATARRNKPTLNVLLSERKAVLAGDLLLARAVSELCELGNSYITQRMAEVVENLSTGEWLQLDWLGKTEVSEEILSQIRFLKTGALMEWCCEVPFVLMGCGTAEIKLARTLGRALGSAFQLRDDCLDFIEGTGKAAFKDWHEGLLNSVFFEVLKAGQPLPNDPTSFEDFKSSAVLRLALEAVFEKVTNEIERALTALESLETEGRNFFELKQLIEFSSKRMT